MDIFEIDGCIKHQAMLNYVSGTLRNDFVCFGEEDTHAIEVHLMLCEKCASAADILREQLKDQAPWFKGRKEDS